MKKQSLIRKCREKLLRLKEEYQRSLHRQHNFKNGGDLLEMATQETQIHHSSHFRSRMSRILPEIELALDRIDKRTYGICEVTGLDIEPKRLLAVPWTRVSLAAIENEAS